MMLSLLALAAAVQGPPDTTRADRVRTKEIVWQVLNVVDTVQTCYIVESGRGTEANPILRYTLGKRPKCVELALAKITFGALHFLLYEVLSDRDIRDAERFENISLIVQGGVVAANMRFVF